VPRSADGFLVEDADPLFDLTVRGIRSASFTFTLINASDSLIIKQITPLRDDVPTLSHDTTRVVKRTLTLTLNVADTAIFDEVAHRVIVGMELEDGRTLPLGTYMAVSMSRMPTSAGDIGSIALTDEMFVISQPISESFAVDVNNVSSGGSSGPIAGTVSDGITDFLNRYPLFTQPKPTPGNVDARRVLQRRVEFSNFIITNAWQTGTNGTAILEDMAIVGDYFTPWLDHTNAFRMIRTFNPAEVVATFDLDAQRTVVRDAITRTNDLLNTPNRIVVVSNSGSGENRDRPVIGTFDVPASAPHSVQNRGFVVSEVLNVQVSTSTQAFVVARNTALNQRIAERVELVTPPDPRHDSYDVIRWDGQLWLETAWSMALSAGGEMSHTLQRIYL
jgi:hypothetical protein